MAFVRAKNSKTKVRDARSWTSLSYVLQPVAHGRIHELEEFRSETSKSKSGLPLC
jgi:hypothetical protein